MAIVNGGTGTDEQEATIVVTLKEYHRLVERDDWLDALEAAGVDNWDGCDVAKDIMEEWQENGS